MRNVDPLPGLLGASKQMCQHWVTWSRNGLFIRLNLLRLPPQTSAVEEG